MKRQEIKKLHEYYQNNKKYFDHMAKTHGADYYDSILRLLESSEISPIGKKILDVGCGSGTLVKILKKKFGKDFDAVGIDISELGKSGKYLRFVKASAMDLPFKDKVFDMVFVSDVLEHLESPQKALKEAKRVLKNGGVLIIRTPNYSHPFIFGFRPFDAIGEVVIHYLKLGKGLKNPPKLSCDLSDECLGGDSDAVVGIKNSELVAELKKLKLNLLKSETWGGGMRRSELFRLLNSMPIVSLLGSSITLIASA